MPSLKLIFGPMFAGKTTELLRCIRILKIINKEYIIISPSIDNRINEDTIVSHNSEKEQCIKLNSLSDIYENDFYKSNCNNIDTIFIDEGQFFSDLKDITIQLLEKENKNIVISGLIGDYNRNKFGQMIDLIPYGAEIIQLTSLCLYCMDGTPAYFSHRKDLSDEQIHIGSNDIYVSLCRKHYLESCNK